MLDTGFWYKDDRRTSNNDVAMLFLYLFHSAFDVGRSMFDVYLLLVTHGQIHIPPTSGS